jgi:hypothetical protein
LSHEAKSLFPLEGTETSAGKPTYSLRLPIKSEPKLAWETDFSKWICVDDFGAVAGDYQDDSDAIQRAIDAAVAKKATVLYFRGCGGPDPNGFTMTKQIALPKTINRVIGLGWARLMSDIQEGGETEPGFIVDEGSADIVKFQNIDSFGGPPINLINRSTKSTMVIESCGVTIIGDGAGDIFATDCPVKIDLRKANQHLWGRQIDPEGEGDKGLVQNKGGHLWCLGIKHEGRGIRFSTTDGGSTELFGLFNYGGYPDELDMRALFDVRESRFSVAALREIAFDSHTATNKVREVQKGNEKVLDKSNEGGWIGWSIYRSAER